MKKRSHAKATESVAYDDKSHNQLDIGKDWRIVTHTATRLGSADYATDMMMASKEKNPR